MFDSKGKLFQLISSVTSKKFEDRARAPFSILNLGDGDHLKIFEK
jgi:hypothetical protein